MKLLCLTTKIDRPSTRYRLLQYLPFFAKADIDVQVKVIASSWQRIGLLLSKKLLEYQAIFIQKKLLSRLELSLLYCKVRKKKIKIVYDYDDAIMYQPTCGRRVQQRAQRFQALTAVADLIIAGNQYLAAEAETGYRNKIRIVPTVLHVAGYKAKDSSENKKDVIIGWIGTKSTIEYLRFVVPVLAKLQVRYPQVRFKVVSDKKPDLALPGLIYKQWCADLEVEQLRSFDVGIMPLPQNKWTEGKCGFKLVQYAAVAIPAVCSPVGVNKEIVKDAVTGFWADSLKDWEDRLSTLIESGQFRKQLGLAGRQHVAEKYNLDHWGPYLAKQIQALDC